MSITWSDSDNECDGENVNKVIAYICKCNTEGESSDEDLTSEEIDDSFKLLITKWEEACMEIERLKKIISDLHQIKRNLLLPSQV